MVDSNPDSGSDAGDRDGSPSANTATLECESTQQQQYEESPFGPGELPASPCPNCEDMVREDLNQAGSISFALEGLAPDEMYKNEVDQTGGPRTALVGISSAAFWGGSKNGGKTLDADLDDAMK